MGDILFSWYQILHSSHKDECLVIYCIYIWCSTYDDVSEDDDDDLNDTEHRRTYNGDFNGQKRYSQRQRENFHGYPRGYPASRGYPPNYPNAFNGYSHRDREGYGNSYQRQPDACYGFPPRTFGYQHDPYYGGNPQYLMPDHYWNGTYDSYPMQGPSYSQQPRNDYGRQRPYSRQGGWSDSRNDMSGRPGNYSRQNSRSGTESDMQGYSMNFSRRPYRRTNTFNPYSSY